MHRTNEIRKALNAKIVVFQCPASFKESEENINNMRDFFRSIDNRGDIKMIWEQRVDWSNNTIGNFNNDTMYEDALRFMKMMRRGGRQNA